jgi:ELWxxDGT repeat protein
MVASLAGVRAPKGMNLTPAPIHSRIARARNVEHLESRQLLAAQPQLLADVFTGPAGSDPRDFAELDQTVYFLSGAQLYRSEQNPGAFPFPIHDPVISPPLAMPDNWDPKLLYLRDGAEGAELWQSNGLPGGATPFLDFVPDPQPEPKLNPSVPPVKVGAHAYFVTGANPAEPVNAYRTTGEFTFGTVLLGTFAAPNSVVNYPRQFTPVGEDVYFTGFDPAVGRELWRWSPQSGGGATLVKDLNPGAADSILSTMTTFQDRLYFVLEQPGGAHQIWTSDGTAAGTTFTGLNGDSLTAHQGNLYFFATDAGDGSRSLMRWNGKAGSWAVTMHTFSNTFAQQLGMPVSMGALLFFAGADATSGVELWKTDGTADGTRMVRDVNPGTGGSITPATRLVAGADQRLYFAATEPAHGTEMWTSDGTRAGTLLLGDVRPGAAGSDPAGHFFGADRLYFTADDGTTGREPWVYVPDSTPPFAVIDDRELIVRGNEQTNAISLTIDPQQAQVQYNLAPDPLLFSTADYDRIRIVGGAGDDSISLYAGGLQVPPTRFVGGSDGADIHIDAAVMSFDDEISADGNDVMLTVGLTGDLVFNVSQHLTALFMFGGSITLTQGGDKTLFTRGLQIVSDDAVLDLNNNYLLVDYVAQSNLESVQARINSARNFGAWDGPGITSSAARDNALNNTTLGAMEAADYLAIHGPGATFAGEPIDDTAVLVKYTYYGDTDFNGFLDGDDYARADNGYNFALGGWTNGDADGNGFIDGDDYSLIDNAYNTQSGIL